MCFSRVARLGDVEDYFQPHIAPFKHPSICLFVLLIVYFSLCEHSEKGGDSTSLPSQGRGRIMNKKCKTVMAIVFRGIDTLPESI